MSTDETRQSDEQVTLPSPVAQALHQAFHGAWGGPTAPLDLYATSPIWEAQAEAVERIVAERLAEVARRCGWEYGLTWGNYLGMEL